MKHVCFLISKDIPDGAYAACVNACENLSRAGAEAFVTALKPLHGSVPDCPTHPFTGFADPDSTKNPHPSVSDSETSPGSETGILLPEQDSLPETLYVTDSPLVLLELKEKNIPIIALQHEGNADIKFRGADFIFSEPDMVDYDSYLKAYQRLKGEPWEILKTKRLLLRETTVEDVDAFYNIYAEPKITRYMEGLFPDPADEKRYMEDYIRHVYGFYGFGVWTIILRKTGEIIGRAGFSVRNGFENAELGFIIGVPWQGQGLAQEACKAVLEYGREVLDIHTVRALVREENEVSLHILKKLGFKILRSVKVEENIYGSAYPGYEALQERAALSPSKYGTYLEMIYKSGAF